MKAVVLFSGGLDSSVALNQAMNDGAEEIIALTATYGSLHQTQEWQAAVDVTDEIFSRSPNPCYLDHVTVPLPNIFGGGASAVMGDVPIPQEEYKDYESTTEGESVTVVPFRNANLISIAVTMAEVKGYSKVYAGMHASDHGRWAYPDCSPEFLGAFAAATYVGTMGRVRLAFPFVWMTKAEVVTRGVLLDVPLHLTWSCYLGGQVHCGKCPTCLERINAFVEAGWKDPVEYAMPIGEFKGLEEVPKWSQLL